MTRARAVEFLRAFLLLLCRRYGFDRYDLAAELCISESANEVAAWGDRRADA